MTEIQLFKKISQTTLLFVFLIYGSLSHAQIERFVAGTHYQEIANPVNTKDSSKAVSYTHLTLPTILLV